MSSLDKSLVQVDEGRFAADAISTSSGECQKGHKKLVSATLTPRPQAAATDAPSALRLIFTDRETGTCAL